MFGRALGVTVAGKGGDCGAVAESVKIFVKFDEFYSKKAQIPLAICAIFHYNDSILGKEAASVG